MKSINLKFVKNRLDLFLLIFASIVIILNIFISLYHLFIGDIYFHTDIARDILLVEELVNKGSPILIGPRAGGVPGTFFGPLWVYLSTPFYLLGNGNPIFIGIFYWLLSILSLSFVMWLARKILGWPSAMISGAIFSFYVINLSLGFTQTFGSVLLSPFMFYLVYKFLNDKKIGTLLLLLLLHGFLIQFQPAFGVISLTITTALVLYTIFKIKKYYYVFSYLILFIPLITYVIFEVRHNFLQIRALISFIFVSNPYVEEIGLVSLISNRFIHFMGRLNLLQSDHLTIGIIFIFIFMFILYKSIKLPSKDKKKKFLLLFYFYYFAFWVVSVVFKGFVWDFYTLGFLPIAVVVFSSLYLLINRRVFIILLLGMIIFMMLSTRSQLISFNQFSGDNPSSWLTNKMIAQYIYDDANSDFGYFVYSTDEFAYSPKYAMSYLNKLSDKEGNLCEKRKETYLIYGPYVDDVNAHEFWKINRIKLDANPESVKNIGSTKIEKYILDNEKINENHDPNVICDLHFR